MVGKLCIDSGGTKISYRYVKGHEIIEEAEIYQNGNIFTNNNILTVYCKIIEKYAAEKIVVLIGAAGAISAMSLVKELEEKLLELSNVKKIKIISDVELISIANKTQTDSLMFAFGTGSVGVIQIQNKSKIFGGYGSTFGDDGSGYCFGKCLLRTYFIDYDLGNDFPYMAKLTSYLGWSEPRIGLKILSGSNSNVVASLTKEFIDDYDFSMITDSFIKGLIQYIKMFSMKYGIDNVIVFGSVTKSIKVRQACLNNGFKIAQNSSLDAIYSYKFKEE